MTANQVAARKANEERRTNRAHEDIQRDQNRIRESELSEQRRKNTLEHAAATRENLRKASRDSWEELHSALKVATSGGPGLVSSIASGILKLFK